MTGAQIVVVAKEPVPGRVKTRLIPMYGPEGAAALAMAALQDTLDAALGSTASRVVLALDGEPGSWTPPGVAVVTQRPADFGTRLAGAIADAYALSPTPVLLIGMDTPQVTCALLDVALSIFDSVSTDAVFGPADDGGFWCLGLRRPDDRAFEGVPMSTDETGAEQLRRLDELGLTTVRVPALRDVDEPADVEAAAARAPGTRFAVLAAELGLRGAA